MTEHEAKQKACELFTLEIGWKALGMALYGNTDVREDSVQYRVSRDIYYAAFFESLALVADLSTYLNEDDACKKLTQLMGEGEKFHEKLIRQGPGSPLREKK